ncbi:MAG: AAA family ATPase [Acidobacteria bacterium]|nr:AAA family ATPase [Acidobacteriota bacterium]
MEDLGRYASSVGWEPKDPWKKLREKAREQYAKDLAISLSYNESMLEVRPASRWITPPSQQRPRRELFGPLWREGEVAILFGPKSSGKSLLAVQLAEDLARGTRTLLTASSPPDDSSLTTHHSSLAPPVLLIDFELSEQQFTERYTQPPAFPGQRARRTRFKFKRAALQWDGRVPEAFRGNVNKFLEHSIQTAIEQSAAKIVIIDSLNHLPRNMASSAGATSMLKNLKHQAARQGLSILVLANSNETRRRKRPSLHSPLSTLNSPLSLRDLSAHRSIIEIADTVFALGTSTFGPEYRYIKHLASRSTPIAPDADVLTYSLKAIENGKSRIENSSENSPFTIHNSPFSFTFLGPSSESDHLRDYQREAYEQDRAHHREIKKIARLSAK